MKSLKDKKIIDKIILILLITLSILRIVMSYNSPISIYTSEKYDDRLLYEYSNSLSNGDWLGQYNQLTLVKGITFSVFQALCNKLMIPYQIGLGILNIISGVLICLALKPKISKKWLYLTYVCLIFSPINLTTTVAQRNYRNAIIPASVLMVFAGYIGMFLRKNQRLKTLLLWSIISGIALVFFWFVKEDSIWVVPFIGTISLLTFIWLIINEKENRLIKSFILLVPAIILIIVTLLICFMNYKYYGVFTTSDKSNSEFGKMMSNLFMIEDENNIKNNPAWVTKNMLEKAYSVSPTFATLKPTMEMCPAWTETNGETNGDLIIWKIRYVMELHGYYQSATIAKEFCEKVNNELEIAFENNSLTKDKRIHIASQIKGLSLSESLEFIPLTINEINEFSKYSKCETINGICYDEPQKIIEIKEFLRESENKLWENVKLVSNNIINVYKAAAVPTNVLAILGYIIYTVHMIIEFRNKKFEKLNLWLVATGVMLSAFVLSFAINIFMSYFTEKQILAYRTFYSAGVFPLIEVFRLIALYILITEIKEIMGIRKSKGVEKESN